MPNKTKPIYYLRDKLAEMLRETSSVSKPIFGATALLLLGITLTWTVVIGMQQGQPYSAKADHTVPAKQQPESKAAVDSSLHSEPQPQPAVPSAAQPTVQLTKPAATEKLETTAGASVSPVLGKPLRPLKGETLVAYGWQEHPLLKDWRFHSGMDIDAAEGTSVGAVWPGEVKEIVQDKAAGLTVAVVSGEYTVYYGSLASVEVRKGDKLKAGARIGTVGSSQAEPYPHLHLAVKKGDKYIDPAEKF